MLEFMSAPSFGGEPKFTAGQGFEPRQSPPKGDGLPLADPATTLRVMSNDQFLPLRAGSNEKLNLFSELNKLYQIFENSVEVKISMNRASSFEENSIPLLAIAAFAVSIACSTFCRPFVPHAKDGIIFL